MYRHARAAVILHRRPTCSAPSVGCIFILMFSPFDRRYDQ